MQKDVIYLDVDDDITAIIGKVKNAGSKIVALVPPKRIGAIQSAVNLKLVHRAAEQAGKHLVVISNNQALVALASSAGILTAKNLQSRPEMAEIPALAIDNGEDVIDGATLPVGEHAKLADNASAAAPSKRGIDAAAMAIENEEVASDAVPSEPRKKPVADAASGRHNRAKVPNFNTLRKKLFLVGAGILALGGFLVWALVYAPTAKIIITARAANASVDSKVTLASAAQTNLKAGTVKATTKTVKKETSIPFTATGKKDVGTKATGKVTFSTSDLKTVASGVTIPAGTVLTTQSGSTYTTDSGATFSLSNYNGNTVDATVGITATANGASYNGATGSIGGAPSKVSATVTTTTTGGVDKTITVVQQSDIDAVSGAASKQDDSDTVKKDLANQFGNTYVVLDSSFKADPGTLTASPAVGQEAPDGKGTLGGSVTYSLTAVAKSELSKYLDQYFAQQLDGKADQKVYDTGLSDVALTDVVATGDKSFTASIGATGKIGPKINEQTIKEYARGKKYAEIKSRIETINGVDSVDVKFSPFWVTSAPDDVKRIHFEFKVTK